MMKNRDFESGRFVITHNLSHTKEYGIWGNIVYRCTNPNSHLWDSYGGRGIGICKEWLIFENFIRDMGKRPSILHSVDRINVNKGYSAENCRWATPKEQSRNRRNSTYVLVDGEMVQIDDFCEKYGLSKDAIRNRIRRGWDMDKIVSTPIKAKA